MKLILNEQQFELLVKEELLENKIVGVLNENGSLADAAKKIRNLLISGVAAATIITAIQRANLSTNDKNTLIDDVKQTEMAIKNEKNNESDLTKKIKDCERYMAYALKNQGFNLSSTGLKPETLVKIADENNFDLPFLMAVAHLESCFGATSRAKKTNSVFSVGSYDNGKNTVTYSDPNDSVEGYIDLLKRRYLVDGKNIFDLMVPGKFVDKDGHRYASNKNYERDIKSIRNRILKMFPDLG